jgi:molybdate transport system substrate-binding protein
MKLALLILICTLPPCHCRGADLLVFAGAGLRPVLDSLIAAFETQAAVNVAVDYDGTGRLAAKIRTGHRPDVLVAASRKWADILAAAGDVSEWAPLAGHSPALVASAAHPAIHDFHEITNAGIRVAIGDPAACAVGRSTTQMLARAGIALATLNVSARALTVVQLQHWVESGNVDAGFIWDCDAARAPGLARIAAPPGSDVVDVICLCRLSRAPEPEIADSFIAYLRAKAPAAFHDYGYHNVTTEEP